MNFDFIGYFSRKSIETPQLYRIFIDKTLPNDTTNQHKANQLDLHGSSIALVSLNIAI